jgi:hypothetical protein
MNDVQLTGATKAGVPTAVMMLIICLTRRPGPRTFRAWLPGRDSESHRSSGFQYSQGACIRGAMPIDSEASASYHAYR